VSDHWPVRHNLVTTKQLRRIGCNHMVNMFVPTRFTTLPKRLQITSIVFAATQKENTMGQQVVMDFECSLGRAPKHGDTVIYSDNALDNWAHMIDHKYEGTVGLIGKKINKSTPTVCVEFWFEVKWPDGIVQEYPASFFDYVIESGSDK
jgi:hypothetical protein